VLRGERPVIRSDGTLQRDYLYVDDIVDGYMRLTEHLDDAKLFGQAFNFGMDDPKSAREMVEAIISISPYPELQAVVLNQANHEIRNQYLSSEKARRVLGWQPKYTIEEGLRLTMDWYRAYLSENENEFENIQMASAQHP